MSHGVRDDRWDCGMHLMVRICTMVRPAWLRGYIIHGSTIEDSIAIGCRFCFQRRVQTLVLLYLNGMFQSSHVRPS